MADEEVINPKPLVEEKCKPQCIKAFLKYEECAKRIAEDTTGEAHCTGQYFDYWHCIDKCASKKLFALLK
jgi:ubiquinol-cytochrome c reductase subunit 6